MFSFKDNIHLMLAFIGSLILASSLVSITSNSIIILGIFFLLFYLIIIYKITRLKNLTFTMHFFLIYFLLGNIIKTSYILLNLEEAATIGYFYIGKFDFSLNSIFTLFFCQILTLLGGDFSIRLFLKNKVIYNQFTDVNLTKSSSFMALIIWFLLSVLLTIYLHINNYGKHGLVPTGNLPNIVGGFLVYLRNIGIPIIGLVFLQSFILKNPKIKFIGIFIYIFVIFFIGFNSLSRGFIIIASMPLIIIFYNFNDKLINLKFILYTLSILIFIFFTYKTIGLYRSNFYYETDIPINISFSFFEFLNFFNGIIKRIEGSSELMAVISSDINSISSFFTFIFGGPDKEFIIPAIYGFSPDVEDRSYGITLGLTGLLYLSKNYLIVFFGSVFYLSHVFFVERLFINLKYNLASIYTGVIVFLNVWGNMTWFFYYRFFFTILLIYFVFSFLIKIRYR